jgi:hypothetical protein
MIVDTTRKFIQGFYSGNNGAVTMEYKQIFQVSKVHNKPVPVAACSKA